MRPLVTRARPYVLVAWVVAASGFTVWLGEWVEFSPIGILRVGRLLLVLATLACLPRRTRAAGVFWVTGVAGFPLALLGVGACIARLVPWIEWALSEEYGWVEFLALTLLCDLVTATATTWLLTGERPGLAWARGVVAIGLVAGVGTFGLVEAHGRAIDGFLAGRPEATRALIALRPLTETCRLWSAVEHSASPEQLADGYREVTGGRFHPRWDDCID